MKLLITGGAGFVGARLARALLARQTLNGMPIDTIVLADQFALPDAAADLARDARVQVRVGPLLALCDEFRHDRFDGVFHLASAVSGECEADFELGLRSNLDSTRGLLDALRADCGKGGNVPRFVFSSSVAVFGPDASNPMPPLVRDDTLPTPQTSYGTHKLVCEHLVADYTRKGFIDGRSARLMTVTVRPGKPNAAASSFFSGIIREPLAGQEAILPVDPSVSHPVSSPAKTVEGLIAVFEASQEAMGGRAGLNLPALNVRVSEMLDALEAVAGKATRALVKAQPDATIQRIVGGWSKGAVAARAEKLGLKPEREFADIILQYIADHPGAVSAQAMAAAENYRRAAGRDGSTVCATVLRRHHAASHESAVRASGSPPFLALRTSTVAHGPSGITTSGRFESTTKLSPGSSTMSRGSLSMVTHSVPCTARKVAPRAAFKRRPRRAAMASLAFGVLIHMACSFRMSVGR
jgi:nucleoside-diphosphate-sugar epimerase